MRTIAEIGSKKASQRRLGKKGKIKEDGQLEKERQAYLLPFAFSVAE